MPRYEGTGKLAVKIAKLLGAVRVVAAGRDQQTLRTWPGLGADTTIRLDVSETEVVDAFASAVSSGIHVLIDYVWSRPVELLLSAMTRKEFAANTSETRLVQVGESAGPTISLAAAVLRSSPLAILGTARIPPREVLVDWFAKSPGACRRWGPQHRYRARAAHRNRESLATRIKGAQAGNHALAGMQ